MPASLADSAIANKLLEAAVRLFAHKGYPATSTREIVEAAGVTKPMLYYYFQSKEGLLAAALAILWMRFTSGCGTSLPKRENPTINWSSWSGPIWIFARNTNRSRLFYALYFGPDDQKELVDLKQYTQPGHELLMQGVAQALVARPGLRRLRSRIRHGAAWHDQYLGHGRRSTRT